MKDRRKIMVRKSHTAFVMAAAAEVVDERCCVCQTLESGVEKARVAKVRQPGTHT